MNQCFVSKLVHLMPRHLNYSTVTLSDMWQVHWF